MRFTTLVITSLSLALPALCAPTAAEIDPSCQKVYELCLNKARGTVSEQQFRTSPFSVSKECTLAATCFPSSPDDFLAAAYAALFPRAHNTPKSVSVARLPQNLYNSLATPGQNTNQQSYIDAYYSLLATVGGPYPPNTYVIGNWAKIAHWTGFCSGSRSIPYGNLADWFQYFNTVSVPGSCDATSSSATPSSTSSSSSSSSSSSVGPTPTSGAPKELSCAKIYSLCIKDAQGASQEVWRSAPFGLSKGCTLAATCYPGKPDAFLAALERDAFPKSTQAPLQAQTVPRLTESMYMMLAPRGLPAGQQSYIDAYYSTLSALGGPYPVNTVVIGYWEAISAWTGFCSSRAVPYQNLADWFQWSSVVTAPTKC